MADLNDLTTNVNIWNDAKTKAVTVTTDGAKERLDVQALIEGGTFSLKPFVPVVAYDSSGTALTTSWTTIVNYTGGEGRLDFISCALGASTYKVRLTVDGTEVFDIAMSDLNILGLTNAVNVNIWAETALKNFRYRPLAPIDFTTSLKIELAMTTGTGTAYWLVNYRTQS
jgi:hypothetical protein